jgi:hypothetical protein
LRNADPDTQAKVLERGNLSDCNNPTAVLISRIQQASETGLLGISKSDLKGSPEEAWARICAKKNIASQQTVLPGSQDPAMAAWAAQHMAAQQQQLAAQQSLLQYHQLVASQSQQHLLTSQLAPLQQLGYPLQMGAPQPQLASLQQVPGLSPLVPPVVIAPRMAAQSALVPPAPETLAPPPLAPPLSTMPQMTAPQQTPGIPPAVPPLGVPQLDLGAQLASSSTAGAPGVAPSIGTPGVAPSLGLPGVAAASPGSGFIDVAGGVNAGSNPSAGFAPISGTAGEGARAAPY